MAQMELIENYLSAWKRLDSSLLNQVLHDKVLYESQFVFEVLLGKSAVTNYLKQKFIAIKRENIPVLAEYATYIDNPCMVLTQFFIDDGMSGDDPNLIKEGITKSGFEYSYRESVILFGFKDEKISRINLCVIPGPSETKKIDNIDLRNEKIRQLENSI
ncbi:hypothetical protein ACUNWD_07115 [Sunxiuqinia sp. A32]|uniref:hypothetical protein n=1 Tax=Sunxiuqinia sp. A32 TaxID=3461496 RepID=UPI0040467690